MERMHEDDDTDVESETESQKRDIFGEYSDEDSDKEEQPDSNEAAFYDLMRLAKEKNADLREKKQENFERVGFEESEAQEMTNDVMLIRDVNKFMDMYSYLLNKMSQLENNDIHLKVMEKFEANKRKRKRQTRDSAFIAVKRFRKEWNDMMSDINIEDDEEHSPADIWLNLPGPGIEV